jgi:hypothetical protein
MATATFSPILLFPTELVSVACCLAALVAPRVADRQRATETSSVVNRRLDRRFVADRQRATETSSVVNRRLDRRFVAHRQRATETSSVGNRRLDRRFVADRQRATETSSVVNNEIGWEAFRSCQAASHRDQLRWGVNQSQQYSVLVPRRSISYSISSIGGRL